MQESINFFFVVNKTYVNNLWCPIALITKHFPEHKKSSKHRTRELISCIPVSKFEENKDKSFINLTPCF